MCLIFSRKKTVRIVHGFVLKHRFPSTTHQPNTHLKTNKYNTDIWPQK